MRQIKTTITFNYTDELITEVNEDPQMTDYEILQYAKELMSEDLSEAGIFSTQFITAEFVEQP